MTPGVLSWIKRIWLVGLLALAVAFPFIYNDSTTLTILFFGLIFAACASAWNIFAGYTGYIALGHTAYFGIGAYALAIMCDRFHVTVSFTDMASNYSPLYLVPLAGLIAAIISIPLGAIALRTRRHTFVVVTVATFFVVQLMVYNLRDITHGSAGIDMPLATWKVRPFDWLHLNFYYFALALTLIALLISWFIRKSKYGLGLLAIRDDEDRARGLGVRTGTFKLIAFVVSAFLVGMGGAIYAYFQGSVFPASDFNALYDVAFALMAFLGGLGTLSGPVLGALVIEYAQQNLTFYSTVPGLNLILYGVMFLAIILLLPRGVVPTIRLLWVRYRLPGSPPTTVAGPVAALATPAQDGGSPGGAPAASSTEEVNA